MNEWIYLQLENQHIRVAADPSHNFLHIWSCSFVSALEPLKKIWFHICCPCRPFSPNHSAVCIWIQRDFFLRLELAQLHGKLVCEEALPPSTTPTLLETPGWMCKTQVFFYLHIRWVALRKSLRVGVTQPKLSMIQILSHSLQWNFEGLNFDKANATHISTH